MSTSGIDALLDTPLGASRKTAHAILVPHYVHIYFILFFVCITL